MRNFASTVMLLIAASQLTFAQLPDAFMVASVKLSSPGTTFRSRLDAAQFTCTANILLVLILSTYPDFLIWRIAGGPSWLNTEYWDLVAKLPPNMPSNEKEISRRTELMLQTLLTDRFKLAVHRERRVHPVYGLIAAKGGSKLKPSSAGELSAKFVSGRFEFHHVSMEGLAGWLYNPPALGRSTVSDRPVIDRTGLEGLYDFTVDARYNSAGFSSDGSVGSSRRWKNSWG